MTRRGALIDGFLARSGWANAKRAPLAGDASFRRYERVTDGARQAVLMDAPPEKEDVRPFVAIATRLLRFGYSAPRILAADEAHGLLLLEDLGDDLFSHVLRRSPAEEETLYIAAAGLLADLYRRCAQADLGALAPYDAALMMGECRLFSEWFLPAVMSAGDAEKAAREYHALWQESLTLLPALRATLVMRDYHADNLLWLPGRGDLQRVGLLDFQDAVRGSPAYDMVSFLEDARRDVAPETVTRAVAHYLAETAIAPEDFNAAYALLGAQRNCKIIGIFVRLAVRDGKRQYLSYLPRVWAHLAHDLEHPALAVLKGWMEKTVRPEWRGVIAAAQRKASA